MARLLAAADLSLVDLTLARLGRVSRTYDTRMMTLAPHALFLLDIDRREGGRSSLVGRGITQGSMRFLWAVLGAGVLVQASEYVTSCFGT